MLISSTCEYVSDKRDFADVKINILKVKNLEMRAGEGGGLSRVITGSL